MTDHRGDEIEDHDRGLSYDLPKLISRRAVVGLLAGGAGTAVLAACSSSSKEATGTTTSKSGERTAEIPEETAGPYPGDGSNGPNALTESGVVRSDITKSFGGASGVARGVPTAIEMTLLDVADGGTPLAGAAVYLWHCDIDGRYSMYDQEIAGENYLRGVQESDSDGKVSVLEHLPRGLRRPLAAHPLRGLRERAGRDLGQLQAQDVPARPARRTPATPSTPRMDTSRACRTSPRPRWTRTTSSATATPASSRSASGGVGDGIAIKLNVGV